MGVGVHIAPSQLALRILATMAQRRKAKEAVEAVHERPVAENEADGEEYDEEEDDDYDPSKKTEEVEDDEESGDEPIENVPDYSQIQASVSSVRTRHQRGMGDVSDKYQDSTLKRHRDGTTVDVDVLFEELRLGRNRDRVANEWRSTFEDPEKMKAEEKALTEAKEENTVDDDNDKIKIQTSYTFAGKVVTESKLVDANSAEARAYLNSTSFLSQVDGSGNKIARAFVPILRQVPGTSEPTELRIKLKRASLIDKFLSSQGKKLKLSTLEKSRLDWASFVDKRKIKDDLQLHNKAGYLDKQDFLNRVESKRDEHYVQAREAERQRQWKLNNT